MQRVHRPALVALATAYLHSRAQSGAARPSWLDLAVGFGLVMAWLAAPQRRRSVRRRRKSVRK